MVQADSGADDRSEKSGWQLIGNHPEGVEIILHDANTGSHVVASYENISDGFPWEALDCRYSLGAFTHWMPLPKPPSNVDREVEAKTTGEE